MTEISNPHDKFFKATFGRLDVAADFLAHYLPPEVAAALDLTTLELTKDSFVDAELQEHFSDLLYRGRMKRGGAAYVYLLFEHKSAPEELVAFQLLRYKARIWEPLARGKAKKLPPIIPLVIYHGQRPWRIPRNFGALIEWGEAEQALRKYVDEFEHLLLDLSAFSDEDIIGAVLVCVVLLTMKHIFDDDLIKRLPEIARLLPRGDQSALECFVMVIRYVSAVSRPLTVSEFERLKEQLPKEMEEIMETMASTWINEGMQKGLRQGRQEGRQEAGAELTLRMLQRQVGELNARTQARIRKLSFEQLAELGEALLDFKSAKDLAAWLRTHADEAS
ncbi:MAG: Rpn family recombination-promoting nuclease/putative transposase [Blastocatellia bacterium]